MFFETDTVDAPLVVVGAIAFLGSAKRRAP